MGCALDKLIGVCRSNKLVVDEETCRYLDLALCGGNDDVHGLGVRHASGFEQGKGMLMCLL